MAADRSQSRGREAFQSSGRGGAGNIRQASVSRDARPQDGPEDFSAARGREPASVASPLKNFSYGRGGAGNIRSPSRDPASATPSVVENAIAEENEVIRAHVAAAAEGPFSSGRGGVGNILSNSRSRSRGPGVHSTGRGGAGNILPGTVADSYVAELKDDEERIKHAHEAGLHSTGRGGAANITASPDPPVEHLVHTHTHGDYISSGRGGAGNMTKDA
ncbi:hypothetical protein C0991_006364 [Blastosporella zonata]|nr:hypothetical protein C0991_006364 [Blastosporella zonata]